MDAMNRPPAGPAPGASSLGVPGSSGRDGGTVAPVTAGSVVPDGQTSTRPAPGPAVTVEKAPTAATPGPAVRDEPAAASRAPEMGAPRAAALGVPPRGDGPPDAGKGSPCAGWEASSSGPGRSAAAEGTAWMICSGVPAGCGAPGVVLLGLGPGRTPWAWHPLPGQPLLVAGLDSRGTPWIGGTGSLPGVPVGPFALGRPEEVPGGGGVHRNAAAQPSTHQAAGRWQEPLADRVGARWSAGSAPYAPRPTTSSLWAGWGPPAAPGGRARRGESGETAHPGPGHGPVPWIVVHRPAQGADPGDVDVWIGPAGGSWGWSRTRPLGGERVAAAAPCGDPFGRAVFIPWYRQGPAAGALRRAGEWRVLWFQQRWRDEPVVADAGDGAGAPLPATIPVPVPGSAARRPLGAAGWCGAEGAVVVLVAGEPPGAPDRLAPSPPGTTPPPPSLVLGIWRRHEAGHWVARWVEVDLPPGGDHGARGPGAAGATGDGVARFLQLQVHHAGGATVLLVVAGGPARVLAQVTAGGDLVSLAAASALGPAPGTGRQPAPEGADPAPAVGPPAVPGTAPEPPSPEAAPPGPAPAAPPANHGRQAPVAATPPADPSPAGPEGPSRARSVHPSPAGPAGPSPARPARPSPAGPEVPPPAHPADPAAGHPPDRPLEPPIGRPVRPHRTRR